MPLPGRKTTVRSPVDAPPERSLAGAGSALAWVHGGLGVHWRPATRVPGNEKYMDARKYISALVTRSWRSA